MLPRDFEGDISQNGQEAVIIHDGEREELILKINYKIEGRTKPDNFAWVITVPNEPEKYALVEGKIFEQMNKLSKSVLRPPRLYAKSIRRSSVDSLSMGGVELGRRVQVGPYDIQPVRGVGENALLGLNNWLKDNKYPAEDPKHMEYFVRKNYTFLCVRITPKKGDRAVPTDGDLAPLHLSFKTPTPYYPLRFSSLQGVFDVNLHLLTKSKLDYKKSSRMLSQINWSSKNYKKNYKLQRLSQPSSLRTLLKKSLVNQTGTVWFYNNLKCSDVNQGGAISKWTDDVHFTTKTAMSGNKPYRLKGR